MKYVRLIEKQMVMQLMTGMLVVDDDHMVLRESCLARL